MFTIIKAPLGKLATKNNKTYTKPYKYVRTCTHTQKFATASLLWKLTHHMELHPTEVTFTPLLQPIKAGT